MFKVERDLNLREIQRYFSGMVLTLVTSTPVILFTMSGTLKGKIYFIHLEDHLHHQIWKYFAHLEHHHQIFKYWNILPTLTITSSTSLVIRAAPTSPEPSETWQKSPQSQKSDSLKKIKDKLLKFSTSIIFPLLTIVIFFACESGAATSAATFGNQKHVNFMVSLLILRSRNIILLFKY